MRTTVQNMSEQALLFRNRQNTSNPRIRIHGSLINTNTPMLSLDLSSGKIHASPAWSMLTGYKKQGCYMEPEQLYSLLPKKDLAGFVHFMKSMALGHGHDDNHFECHIRNNDDVFIPVTMTPLIFEHGVDGNLASVILLCEPVATPGFVISDDNEVAGEWSIMFSVDDEGTIYPVKFWLSKKYQEMAGLDHLQKTITIEDWLQLIAKEDRKKMKCHMLPLMAIDNSPGMITYEMNNRDSDSKRVFSMATAIVDERHGNIHVKAVDWFYLD